MYNNDVIMVCRMYLLLQNIDADWVLSFPERVDPYKTLRGGVKFVDIIPYFAASKILKKNMKSTAINDVISPKLWMHKKSQWVNGYYLK